MRYFDQIWVKPTKFIFRKSHKNQEGQNLTEENSRDKPETSPDRVKEDLNNYILKLTLDVNSRVVEDNKSSDFAVYLQHLKLSLPSGDSV